MAWWKQLLITDPKLLLQPILRKYNTVGDISPTQMHNMQQTVVNKRDYAQARHLEQFPDRLPIPDHLKDD